MAHYTCGRILKDEVRMKKEEEKNKKQKVSFHTLGCRLNMAETGRFIGEFKEKGYEVVPFGETADIIVLNTCTVTGNADSTCRNLINKACKLAPDGKIIVVGCYAQKEFQKIIQISGVDLVLGTSEKFRIFDYLAKLSNDNSDGTSSGPIVNVDQSEEFFLADTGSGRGRTRSFLKIQDGCDYFCSYCIVPVVRGRNRGISISDCLKSVSRLIDDGVKEIVLTGVNVGEYFSDDGKRLVDLMGEILKVRGLKRLRLSSIEPNTITDELLNLLSSSPLFMNHFHLPLQYGDDEILKRMGRKYFVDDFYKVVSKIKMAFSDCLIGTDIIVGFPGEEERHFNSMLEFLEDLPVDYFHVFPYSKREGTKAAKLFDNVSGEIKKARAKILRELGHKKYLAFSKKLIGPNSNVNNVLFEKNNSDDFFEGYTTNFLKVFVRNKSGQELQNQIKSVRLDRYEDGRFYGTILN